jgi:hypothetical protein
MKKFLILLLVKAIFIFSFGCTKQLDLSVPVQKFSLKLNNRLVRIHDTLVVNLKIRDNSASDFRVYWSASNGRIEGNNVEAKFYAPDIQGSAIIEAKITDQNNISYTDTARIKVYKQLVLLKADDVFFDKVNTIPAGWRSFIDYIISKNIKASLGLIGNSLVQGNEAYFSYLKSLEDSGNFELWNHGYNHLLDGTDVKGNKFEEFLNSPLEYQAGHLLQTQNLAKVKLNIILHTFGAPGNAIDTTTIKAIKDIGDIKVWYFGLENPDKFVLKRSIEIEYPTGIPDFNKFQTYYTPLDPYLVIQIHPNVWDETKFSEFKKMIDFLIQKDVTFINPYEYYQLTH